MAAHEHGRPGPPGPAPVKRKFRLLRHQWITIPLLLAIPVLGLAGVVDEQWQDTRATAGGLELSVVYPDRARFRSPTAMDLTVRNTGHTPLQGARVRFDPALLDGFGDLAFTPSPQEGLTVELGALAPGERRVVRVEMRPEDLGTNRGTVRAEAAGAPAAEVEVRTFVLP